MATAPIPTVTLETATPEAPIALKSYKGPWKGQLLLACGKCQKKLKDDDLEDAHGLAKLKKALKQRSKRDDSDLQLIVIKTQCLKVCPRRGVAVCTQAQVGAGRCSIVRTSTDVDALYAQCKAEELGDLSVPVTIGSLNIAEHRKRRQTR